MNGVLDGTTFPLAERAGSWDQRVWGANFRRPTGGPVARARGEYVVALTSEALAADADLFDGFAQAVRTGDVESAHLLSVQAQAHARR